MQRLNGKVAFVTGGSRGLGAEIADAFATEGASVIVASRNRSACEEYADQLTKRHGNRHLGLACNVGSWSSCDEAVETAYAEFGRIDILVNNAGMSPIYPSLEEVSEELWEKVIGVNLRGPFRLSSLIGTRMTRDGGGTIINISSMAATKPSPHYLPYAAAKAGLNTLTEGFAQAFGPTVRVNTIQCGAFRTDVAKAWTQDVERSLAKNAVLDRIAEAREIRAAALYFATDDSSYCTGARLALDGGI